LNYKIHKTPQEERQVRVKGIRENCDFGTTIFRALGSGAQEKGLRTPLFSSLYGKGGHNVNLDMTG